MSDIHYKGELNGFKLLRIYAKHEPYWDTGHLGTVVNEMRNLGAPTIKVVYWRNEYFALEGSHRLAAAHYLGLVPKLDILDQDRFDSSDEEFWQNLQKELTHFSWAFLVNEEQNGNSRTEFLS